MNILTHAETQEAAGGLVAGTILPVVVAVGGLLAFAYSVGKDMAERDNALSCPADP